MTTDTQKEEIKSFLQNFFYNIMHESCKDNIEHYFLVIEKEDINTVILKNFFDAYVQKYPINNVSSQTTKYIQNNSRNFYFISIDQLHHHDPFFKEKDSFIRVNSNNIVCFKMIGEPADFSSHLENKLDVYLEQFKGISIDMTILAREKAKNKFKQSKTLFNNKSPIVKQSIYEIGLNLKSKIQSITKKL